MSDSNNSGGISFCSGLGLLFIGLKLGGIIGWSWWWVTAPFWGPAIIVLLLLIILAILK